MDKDKKLNVTIDSSSYDNGILYRICPKCGKEKPMSEFGLRKMDENTVRNQSWCKDCR